MRYSNVIRCGLLSLLWGTACAVSWDSQPEAVSDVEQALGAFCSGKANGTACNDYNPLTQNDKCQGGTCVAGTIPASPRPSSPDLASYPSACIGAKTTYSVLIKTGDAPNADTRAAVTLQLGGTTASGVTSFTSNLSLSNATIARNSKFFKAFAGITSVREITQLKISQNQAGTSPSWLVDWVEVQDSCSGRRYHFDLQRWLGKDNATEAAATATVPVSTGGPVHKVKLRPVFLAPIEAAHRTSTPNGSNTMNVGVGYGRGCLADQDQNGYVEPVAGYGGPVSVQDWEDLIKVTKIAKDQWEKLLGVGPGQAFEIDIPPAPMVVSCKSNDYLTDTAGGGAAAFARQVDELFKAEGTDRYESNTIYLIVYWRPLDTGYFTPGGRTFNGNPGTGGGGLYLDFWDFRFSSLLLSTLVHEIGHTMGLTHVDVYGLSMDTSTSVMSYNPANHSIDRFTPSATPGTLLDVERAKLTANKDVLPFYTIDAQTMARGQATTGYSVNLGPMSVPLSDVDGKGYRILDRSGTVVSGPETITWSLSDGVSHCQNVMGFNQDYTYQFNSANYRSICKGYELFFNGSRVGFEPTWSIGTGIDNCIWNFNNNPTLNPTCRFNGVDVTTYARSIQAAPNGTARVFEYDKLTTYSIPFGPSSGRCQAIGASAGRNMFSCYIGNARAY